MTTQSVGEFLERHRSLYRVYLAIKRDFELQERLVEDQPGNDFIEIYAVVDNDEVPVARVTLASSNYPVSFLVDENKESLMTKIALIAGANSTDSFRLLKTTEVQLSLPDFILKLLDLVRLARAEDVSSHDYLQSVLKRKLKEIS